MTPPVLYEDPFRLRVLKALSASLKSITVANGYKTDLGDAVFRGRDLFGDGDPVPMLSILEKPLPEDFGPRPAGSVAGKIAWSLIVQGFVRDDKENPTDPAHFLLADVKRCLAAQQSRTAPGTLGMVDPLGMGIAQQTGGRSAGNSVQEILIGPGIVRPPEAFVSTKAYFWLDITLMITEDATNPFL